MTCTTSRSSRTTAPSASADPGWQELLDSYHVDAMIWPPDVVLTRGLLDQPMPDGTTVVRGVPRRHPGPVPARMRRLPVTTAVWLAGVALAGLVVRAIPVALADFPVNDGGLFVAMTRAIEDAGWGLPLTISWNGSELPFAYPPLGFYLSGGISSLFGLDLTDVFRWLPLVASALVVPAVFLLARELLRSDLGALVAALAYALAPASYVWLVQGGGVTRSPGMLLAVLTIWQVVRLVRAPGPANGHHRGRSGRAHRPRPPRSRHLRGGELGPHLALRGTDARPRSACALVSVAIALLVAAPWLAITISRHGLDALLGVPSNGPEPAAALLAVLAGRVTGTASFDPLAIAGVVVAIVWLVRRQFLLPIWFGVATLLSYQYGMVPFGAAHRFGGGVPRRPADHGDRSRRPEGSAGQPWDPGRGARIRGRRIGPGRAESRCAPSCARPRAAGGHGVGGCQPGTGGRAGGDHEQRVVRRSGLRVVLPPRRAPLGGHRPGLGMAGRGGL